LTEAGRRDSMPALADPNVEHTQSLAEWVEVAQPWAMQGVQVIGGGGMGREDSRALAGPPAKNGLDAVDGRYFRATKHVPLALSLRSYFFYN
jgi:hypothetical protein